MGESYINIIIAPVKTNSEETYQLNGFSLEQNKLWVYLMLKATL